MIITDLYRSFEEDVLCKAPTHIIFHFGIVEATTRARPRLLHSLFSKNNWRNRLVDIPYRSMLSRFLIRKLATLYRPIERGLFKCRLTWRYLNPRKFNLALRELINLCHAQTPVKNIFLIAIMPVSNKFECIAPGTRKSVAKFNSILKSIAEDMEIVEYISIEETQHPNSIPFSPDSIHLNASAHYKIADTIDKRMRKSKEFP